MSYIFYIMGKSSSGKDTLYRKIREKKPELLTITGYTTRPVRANEVNGREYFFVSRERMQEMEAAGIVIENRAYQTVHGVWNYFTADDGQVREGREDYLLIGTLESFVKVRDYYGTDRVIPIYIEVEDGIRLKRALEREINQENPKYAELCRRFLADMEDFTEDNIEKCGIERRFFNIDMDECLAEICHFIEEKQETQVGR